MARVFRQTYTTRDRDGDRVTMTAKKWYGEFTDLLARTRRVPLCTDKQASSRALGALTDALVRASARVAVDPDELPLMVRTAFCRALQSAGHPAYMMHERRKSLTEHLADFRTHLEAKGVSEQHLKETLTRLRKIVDHCGFVILGDVAPTPIEQFLTLLREEGIGRRTSNTYLESIRAFCNWCMKTARLDANPLVVLSALNTETDIRHERRAPTEDELQRLLDTARVRPLEAAMTIRSGTRKGQLAACLKPEYRAWLERCGRERALLYKTLVLTGLRKAELTALRWGDLDIDGGSAWVTVRAVTAKNKKTETLPIRDDLAGDLRAWRIECGTPAATDLVFKVPRNLVRILRKDLKAAGIPVRDELGRVIDVHALRHATATYMAKAGVAPRTAQAMMRHSNIGLTMKNYTDVRLLDERSAVDAMPKLDLNNPFEQNQQRATGTDDCPVTIDSERSARKASDFLVSSLAFYLAKRGSPQRPGVSSHGTEEHDRNPRQPPTNAEGTATYDHPLHRNSPFDTDHPQRDSNPCLQDENLIS